MTGPGEAVLEIRGILRGLCGDGRSAPLDDVLRLSAERGIAAERATAVLRRMRSEGDVYEPATGTYRLTELLR